MWLAPQRSHGVTLMWDTPSKPVSAVHAHKSDLKSRPPLRPNLTGPFRSFGVLLLAAAAVLATPSSSPAQSVSAWAALAALRPQAQRRVAPNPDMGPRVQLRGHLPGWVRAENTAAAAVANRGSLNVAVALKRDAATQAAFEQLLAAQQTPGSALYHQWLTPVQVGSMFGLAPSDLRAGG